LAKASYNYEDIERRLKGTSKNIPSVEDFFRQARRQVPPIPVGIAWVLLTTAGGKKTGDGRGGGF
jgi:hypothetical protein